MVLQPTASATPTSTRILDAAETLFAELGYTGASVKQIARRAGVTGAMINYYFQSKENLYRAVLDRIVADLEAMAAVITATQKPSVERLDIYLRWFFDYVVQHPNFSRLTVMGLGDVEHTGHLAQTVRERFRPLYEMGVAFFAHGSASGLFATVDVFGLLVSIYGTVITYCAERDFLRMLTGVDPFDPAMLEQQKQALVERVFRILGVATGQ